MKPFNIQWASYRLKQENLKYIQKHLVELLNAMDSYVNQKVWVHCIYDPDRGSSNYHARGMAADLHIADEHPIDQFLIATRFNFGGIGLYGPDVWNNPGLHVDVRPQFPASRWCRRAVGNELLYLPLNSVYLFDLMRMIENEAPKILVN